MYALLLRAYCAWTRAYRALWERAFAPGTSAHLKLVLRAVAFTTLDSAAEYLMRRKSLWNADGAKQGFDAVSYPARAHAIFERDIEAVNVDCDEFATWAAFVLGAHAELWGIKSVCMLSIGWRKGLRFDGHNACGIEWVDGTFSYMDYGYPSKRLASWNDVVSLVTADRAPESRLVGWGRIDPLEMTYLGA